MPTIERGDFWEFKARCAELDLELAKLQVTGELLAAKRNAVVETFAAAHGLDPAKPMLLDDVTLTVTQARPMCENAGQGNRDVP